MTHASALSDAKAQARKSGSPYAVIPAGGGFTVRKKSGFFEKLPKGSCTAYPSGKVFPPIGGPRARATCKATRRKARNPELLVVRNNPRRRGKPSLFPLRTFHIWKSGGITRTVKAHTANEAASKVAKSKVLGVGGSSPGPWHFTSAGGRGDSIKVWEDLGKNPRRRGKHGKRASKRLLRFRGSRLVKRNSRKARSRRGKSARIRSKRRSKR